MQQTAHHRDNIQVNKSWKVQVTLTESDGENESAGSIYMLILFVTYLYVAAFLSHL